MDTERRALNPLPLGGPQPPRLLDRFQPSVFNTNAILHRSFPAHALEEDGYDIRTVQERLGGKDVTTTMIYNHVPTRGPSAVRSPADRLLASTRSPAELGCTSALPISTGYRSPDGWQIPYSRPVSRRSESPRSGNGLQPARRLR